MWGSSRLCVGALLFIVFINDLPCNAPFAETYTYADDISFVTTGSDLNVIKDEVANAVGNASRCFAANSLLLNNTKTQSVLFSLRHITDNTPTLEYVKSLGVTIDKKLSWNFPVEQLSTGLSVYF